MTNIEQILALDIGDKRVGVAIAGVENRHCRPLETFDRAAKHAERKILEIIHGENIKTLVVGLPLHANGSRTTQCESVEKFCSRLVKRCDWELELKYVDEYASSVEAEQRLRQVGSQKVALDSASAVVILERYFAE